MKGTSQVMYPSKSLITFDPKKSKPLAKKNILPGESVITIHPGLKYPFKGCIVKCLEHTAIIEITETVNIPQSKDPSDKALGIMLNNRVLVAFNEIYNSDILCPSNHFINLMAEIDDIKNEKNKIYNEINSKLAKIENLKEANLALQSVLEQKWKDIRKFTKESTVPELTPEYLLNNWTKDALKDKQPQIATAKQNRYVAQNEFEITQNQFDANTLSMQFARQEISDLKRDLNHLDSKLNILSVANGQMAI